MTFQDIEDAQNWIMADHRLIIKHVLNFEGGHSADPADNALRFGHSGVPGGVINPATGKPYDPKHPRNFIHTNKGITWATYVSYCRNTNKIPNAPEFLAMPYNLWLNIFKKQFWDKIKGDQIRSQAVAEYIFEAVWGGGGRSLIRNLQRYLTNLGAKINVTGDIDQPTINAINSYLKGAEAQNKVIDYLTEKRLQYLQSLSDWPKYGRGWTRRVNELKNRALNYIKKLNFGNMFKLFAILGAGFFFLAKNRKD